MCFITGVAKTFSGGEQLGFYRQAKRFEQDFSISTCKAFLKKSRCAKSSQPVDCEQSIFSLKTVGKIAKQVRV